MQSHTDPITLTLVIPMYNEEKRITKCLRALRTYKPPKAVEIDRVIFVSDGSHDTTLTKLMHTSIPYPMTVLAYEKNQGRGHAIRMGMSAATGEYALWLDVDMSTPLTEIAAIMPSIRRDVPVIIGSRKIKGAITTKPQPLYRILLGQGFSKLSEIFLEVPVGDFTCGFKAFSRRAYTQIFPITKINGWGNDSESLFLAQKLGFTIKELPIHWHNDPRTKVKVVRDMCVSFMELVKIRWYDATGVYTDKPMTQPVLAGA